MEVRNFGKLQEIVPVPSLTDLQAHSYDSFIDFEANQRSAMLINSSTRYLVSSSRSTDTMANRSHLPRFQLQPAAA